MLNPSQYDYSTAHNPSRMDDWGFGFLPLPQLGGPQQADTQVRGAGGGGPSKLMRSTALLEPRAEEAGVCLGSSGVNRDAEIPVAILRLLRDAGPFEGHLTTRLCLRPDLIRANGLM
jgi:hypothetical protein